ncbi:MAG: homoserine O-succinyltransferase [Lachnospiraceae bacterium]|nr:homoserine O-succinyltransferase [Lachnospiraceae bacterium]
MPIKVPNDLPVRAILEKENIFVMDENRAIHQDIRPIQILILNLMPIKEDTELQILRELSNTPLQIDCTFMRMRSHDSKNTSKSHLDTFYVTFDQIKRKHYDGMIVTGAPVELYEFEDVDYWDEISQVFSWINTHVTSTIYLCWAAQAAMYYYYGLQKKLLDKKMFGLFQHKVFNRKVPLVRGFDDQFLMPHSRYTDVPAKDIANCPELTILAQSKEAGVFLCMAENGRKIYVTGHPEYGRMQLRREYERDKKKGIEIDLPKNYFPDDDPGRRPPLVWRAHANNLYTNWLNYYVYQSTPYDLDGTPWGDEIPDNYSEKRIDEK